MSSWERRKWRLENDPEFRERVRAQQRESARRRRSARGEPECQHRDDNGARCWLTAPHRHGGPLTALLVPHVEGHDCARSSCMRSPGIDDRGPGVV